MGGIKWISVLSLLLVGIVSMDYGFAFSRCGGLVGARCFSVPDAVESAASPEEAAELRDHLKNMTGEQMLNYCQEGGDTVLLQFGGQMCGDSKILPGACHFRTTLNCRLNGKTFDFEGEKSCVGGLQDCGTFRSCFLDRREAAVRMVQFRKENDFVPKQSPRVQ